MQTKTQLKFDRIIKEGFQEILKPLGFKKKANNFYLQLEELGQIINVQKSAWGTRDEISFTINVGIFVPEYWLAYYNFQDRQVPKFPTEPECLIRQRIGRLRNQHDTWYDLKIGTDENMLIEEMHANIQKFILPYFESTNTQQKLIQQLETEKCLTSPLGKLIIFGELKQFNKAKIEYQKLLKEKTNPYFLANVKTYGTKYKLE